MALRGERGQALPVAQHEQRQHHQRKGQRQRYQVGRVVPDLNLGRAAVAGVLIQVAKQHAVRYLMHMLQRYVVEPGRAGYGAAVKAQARHHRKRGLLRAGYAVQLHVGPFALGRGTRDAVGGAEGVLHRQVRAHGALGHVLHAHPARQPVDRVGLARDGLLIARVVFAQRAHAHAYVAGMRRAGDYVERGHAVVPVVHAFRPADGHARAVQLLKAGIGEQVLPLDVAQRARRQQAHAQCQRHKHQGLHPALIHSNISLQ